MEVELDVKIGVCVPEAESADGYKGLKGNMEESTTIDLDKWDIEPLIEKIRILMAVQKLALDFTLRYEEAKAAGCDMTKWPLLD